MKKEYKTQNEDKDIQSEEILAKYDREHAFRIDIGKWAWVVTIIGAALTIFHLFTAYKGVYPSLIQGPIHLGTGLALIFILYPARKHWTSKSGVAWYDVILALLALFTNYYIVFNYERLINGAIIFGYSPFDIAVATIGIVLLLEGTRRAVGVPIVIIAVAALAYGLWGTGIPMFGHAGFDWKRLSTEMFFKSNAIFGIPIQISSQYIYLFLFFGVMLVKTDIGKFFNDLAFALTGRFTGGTAKAAVAASGLQGMVTGSSVANTVGSGSFTIPMMKRAGFRPEFAAATEASASTGGQIMPPIMGAAAFIMAEYTGVPYSEIIIIAIIPAVLYFSGVFMGTHFEAKKQGILGVSKEDLPKGTNLLKKMDLLLPLVTIVWMLLSGRTPTYAALWGIGIAFAVSLFRKATRMSLREMLDALEQGARTALPVISACATAGIVVGIVVLTGLGGKIAGGIIELASGNFFLILFFTMLASILLGMGLPTTANYVVTASMAAPAILNAFPEIPVIAVHMFVFYFGIVADITPPVSLAAYAGAGIAGANPMKSGITAFKLAIAAFIIPYIFVMQPELLLQEGATFVSVLPAVVTALLGMAGISSAMIGFFVRHSNFIERIVLFSAGILLIYPNLLISLVGLAVLAAMYILQSILNKKDHRKTPTPQM
ncbi:TRAP transporter permease [Bacillus marinisedimentorum]|uniref:TRAP transporter permease n=1 Tax=Bacillus marinisedimentorum TaxID=1821260 RepID=UPI000871C869|nr:TRAP transporter permease [Bacillus marinisedimentorum]